MDLDKIQQIASLDQEFLIKTVRIVERVKRLMEQKGPLNATCFQCNAP